MAKHGKSAHASPRVDRAHLDRAMSEGRFQQGLELAKQLYKHEPTPAHLQILKDAYLGRARQQVNTGHSRDAQATLTAAAQLDRGDKTWLGALATTLAAAGGVGQALSMLGNLAPAEADRVRVQAVDSAVRLNTAGRGMLPQDLYAEFDRILQAFGQVAAEQDEAARETLQGIGLRSPFLEWKVLLRGMQAWYAKDDTRALEILQRLDPNRLPAQLAAPFRARLEPAYLAAQPAVLQNRLKKQIDRLADSGLMNPLRVIRAELDSKNGSLAQAFRQAEGLLPLLRKQFPGADEQLASCFYWAILDSGPEDVTRYQRVFGAPPADPHFNRLRALAGERHGDDDLAREAWQLYEQDLANKQVPWPEEQRTRARALIWLRLASNAVDAAKAPPDELLDIFDDRPKKRKPPEHWAEKCFLKSIELAPDQIGSHAALVQQLLDQKQIKKAEKAARNLLQRFPDHSQTLELLADFCKDDDPAEALDLLDRAQRANPLNAKLSAKLFEAHLELASRHAALNQLAEARQHLDTAATFDRSLTPGRLLALRAAIAFKTGEKAVAETLLTQANTAAVSPVLISFLLLGEAVRLKLDKSLKTRFDKAFKESISVARPAVADAARLARFVANLPPKCLEYHGSKTHKKKIIDHLLGARLADATEGDWRAISVGAVALGAGIRAVLRCAQDGQRRFPASPVFYLAEAEALFKHGKVDRGDYWQLRQLVSEAEQLARALPPSEQRDNYLAFAAHLMEKVNALHPLMAMMHATLGGQSSDPDEDDDDYDEDEFSDW